MENRSKPSISDSAQAELDERAMLSLLYMFFHPTIDAIFAPLPFTTRLRLLSLQPLALLIYILKTSHKLFSQPYTVRYIPTRRPNEPRRSLVYDSHPAVSHTALRPLHLDIHGGSFIGCLPENDHRFCLQLARSTGAVVVSASYRFAPRYPFPAAIDDIDDVLEWLVENAEEVLHADPTLLTVSGFSAGANLALAACMNKRVHSPSPTAVKGSVTFCAPVDLRLPPEQKPKPPGFPTSDPLKFLHPLYDAYASPKRAEAISDPRMNPIIAPLATLPLDMLFIIPRIDILLHEQQTFVARLEQEIADENQQGDPPKPVSARRRIQAIIFENGFHGWLELPSIFVGEEDKVAAYGAACEFIQGVHERHGYFHNAA